MFQATTRSPDSLSVGHDKNIGPSAVMVAVTIGSGEPLRNIKSVCGVDALNFQLRYFPFGGF